MRLQARRVRRMFSAIGLPPDTCEMCTGSGTTLCTACGGIDVRCTYCDGLGEVICDVCVGAGYRPGAA